MAFARWLWVIGASVAACSSNDLQNGSTAPGDGGDDGSNAQGDSGNPNPPTDSGGPNNGDENPPAAACTAPPFVDFKTTVSMVGTNDVPAPVSGATVQFTTCAGFQITTAADGTASTKITQGVPLSPIYSAAPAAITGVGAEIPASASVVTAPLLIAQAATDVIPIQSYTGQPTILIAIEATGTTPCDAVDGVTVSATNHPEMVAHYMKTGWPADKTVGSNTASVGTYAFFSGFAQDAGESAVQLTATKTGCTVHVATASQTGRFVLLKNAITVGKVTVAN